MTFHLPRSNRYFRMSAQVRQRTGIVLMQRLLEPRDVAVFNGTAEEFGLYWVEQVICVDHEIDVVAHGVANGANASGILTPTFLVYADDEFQCREAQRQLQLCGFAQLFTVVLRKPIGYVGR